MLQCLRGIGNVSARHDNNYNFYFRTRAFGSGRRAFTPVQKRFFNSCVQKIKKMGLCIKDKKNGSVYEKKGSYDIKTQNAEKCYEPHKQQATFSLN